MAKKKARPVPTLPFDHFLSYDEVTAFLEKLAAARPEHCALSSLGPSREGRQVHLLTVTDFASGDPEDRPAYLIHGNIHAAEVAGTHMALFTARELVAKGHDLLKRITFYIVPRLNPDGAELVVTTGGQVRSRRDETEKVANALYPGDVNGDDLVLTMRQQHPNGAFVPDPEDPRLMIRRRAYSSGPFYRVLPEGLIHQWDGGEVLHQGGRSFDWNRNWSYDWRPEPEQGGAGDFPFSEPEMRQIGGFLHSHSNLFGVLGYHTGAAAVLRPPSTGSDSDLAEGDLYVLEELARFGAEATGFPVVPVVKYHRDWQRDINLQGHFHNFGYHHLGLFVFEFELGTIRDSAGLGAAEQFAVFSEEEGEAQMRQVMRWWDRRKARTPLFRRWKRFDHPQLGIVEIGGFLSWALANQTFSDLKRIARGTHRFTLEHARRHPAVTIEEVSAEKVGEGIYRIRARIVNRGEFPTHVTQKGRGLRRLRPVRVEFHPEGELLSLQGHFDLGHLAGVTGGRMLEWFVGSGSGKKLGTIRVLGGSGGNAETSVAAG
ncbi:M14 family metallopeptidase [Candidatus Latescibacterota bacterium]